MPKMLSAYSQFRKASVLVLAALVLGFLGARTATAALLGVEPGLPLLNYNNTGTVSYNAGMQSFNVVAQPISILFPPPATVNAPKSVAINIVVDNAGNLVGGVPGDDLVVTGAIQPPGPALSGVLLTGEIVAFGSQDSGGPTDFYDFKFVVTGGLLAPSYAGQDIGVTLTSEGSNFTGNFTVNFGGDAKGNIGPVPPEPLIRIKKQVSVESLADLEANNLLFIPDDPNVDPDGGVWFDADTFGAGPTVGEVGATYRLVVTNTGLVPVTNAQISDILEGEPLGTPAFTDILLGDLQPGESRIIVSSEVADNMLTINPDMTSFSSPLPGVDLLNRPDRCEDEDVVDVNNPATKLLNIARVTADDNLMDENPAWVMCAPELIIKKQVSVETLATLEMNNLLFIPDDPMVDPDGGVWFDADTPVTGPSTVLNATYRLIVTNTGNTVVTNAQITDLLEGEPLGNPAFANVSLGDLQPGESRIIVSSETTGDNMLTINPDMTSFLSPLAGVDLLNRPDRCNDVDVIDMDNPETKFLNVARVTADDNLQDENPAWVMCIGEPELIIKKQVSVETLQFLQANNLLFVPDDPMVDPDGGVWFDADTFATGPSTDLGATYRLIVTNTGTVPVTNAQISDFLGADEPLGNPAFTNVSLGDLAPGESRIIVSSKVQFNMLTINPDMTQNLMALAGVDLLDRPDRCLDDDVVDIDNPATKLLNIARVTADNNLTDQNPAWVMCMPELIIKKQVSVETLAFLQANNLLFIPDGPADPDGGVWFDADTFAAGPSTDLGATYRLIVTNTGNSPVTNAQISDFVGADEPLGNPAFTNVSLGDLAPGESRVIVSSEVQFNMLTINPDMTQILSMLPGVNLLNRPDRCEDDDVVNNDNPATKLLNIARVTADGNLEDENPAWVMCMPELIIKKQVSIEALAFLEANNLLFIPDDPGTDPDGGVWFDADTFGTGPTVGDVGATYRLIVTNTGNTVVTNAQISDFLAADEPLGNPAFTDVSLGDLAPGESRIIVSSEVEDNMLTINPDMTSSLTPLAGVDLLDRPDRCEDDDVVNNDNPATKLKNIARVRADGNITDENEAWVMCVPDLIFKKQVSVETLAFLQANNLLFIPDDPGTDPDGGVWFDADTFDTGPSTALNATYRLVVTNTGNTVVTNAQISDILEGEPLGTPAFIDVSLGNLQPGESRIIVSSEVMENMLTSIPGMAPSLSTLNGVDLLNRPDRCLDDDVVDVDNPATKFLNIARITADGDIVEENPAWVMCVVPDCDINVTKTCLIPKPPTSPLTGKCSGKIQEWTVIWEGAQPITVSGLPNDAPGGVVAVGQEVTFFNPGGGANDVFVDISGGLNGESKFHLSCSDKDMNADNDNDVQQQLPGRSQDCGKFAGNGKSSSGFINDWIFEGLVDADGLELDCTAAPDFPTETEQCEFTPPPPDTGLTCSDIKDITELTMVWDGADGVSVTASTGVTGVSPSTVNNGDVMTIDVANNAPNDIFINLTGGVSGQSKFHISCSDKDMNAEPDNQDQQQVPGMTNDCGKFEGNAKSTSGFVNQWLYAGMAGEGGVISCPDMPGGAGSSTDVIYGITVENLNDEPVDVTIVDDQLGINQMETIAANASLELVTDPVTITPDGTGTDPFAPDVFKNTVVVTGETTVSGAMCEAMDMVKVKRNPPPPQPSVTTCSDLKDVTGLSLIWNGPDGINIQSETGQVVNGIDNGNVIFLDTPKDQTGNDVDVFLSGAVSGQSQFHISCSDSEMNGFEDCGNAEGNGKSNNSSFNNQWIFNGMTGEQGQFDCGLPNTGPPSGIQALTSGSQGGNPGGSGGDVTAAASLDLGDDGKAKWELTNNGANDLFVTRVVVTWPSAHESVKKFKLEGDFAKDVFDSTSPTAVPDEKAFESDAKKRKLKKGGSKKLEIEFTEKYKDHSQGDFTITVEFDNGDVVTFP